MKRDWLTLAFGVALVGTVVGLSLRQNMSRDAVAVRPSEAVPGAEAPAPAAAADAPAPVPQPEPAPETSRRAGSSSPKSSAASEPPAPAVKPPSQPPVETLATLQVVSDVQGASVFLDREFVGTTPLTLRSLTPGSRQLNVTATGHEGYSAAVDLAAGPNRVNVEFMKVRLNASVPVVHRHAMGSCQGILLATVKGLSYETTDAEDAFALPFADINEFEVDYLKKNLRVRRRSGKIWNFTNDNADALFVFHRDVNKARERLVAAAR